MSNKATKSNTSIIFFDNVCNLCDESVNFIIRFDKKKEIKIAPLQGETAKKLLSPDHTDSLNTLVYLKGHLKYIKSGAVIRVIIDINPLFIFFYIALLIPVPIRDFIYNILANHRYQWFGKRSTCRVPTNEEKQYFLP